MKKNVLLLCIILCIAVIGCQQKRIVKPEQPPLQEQPAQKEQSSASQKEPSQWQKDTTRTKSQEEITEQTLAKAETSKESSKFKEESGLFQDIYFEYDAYDIHDDAKPVLQEIAAWLLKNGKTKLSVEGHCDERGTNEYNLALGDRRAKAVRDYLIALGIASGRVQMISYGEEKPICTETTEACWTKNRRAHFVVLREAGK